MTSDDALAERINVLGVGISVLTLETAVAAVLRALDEQRQGYVTVTGVHGVSECQRDEQLRTIHNQSLLSTPDGMPLTWVGRWYRRGREELGRVYGPDLMLRVFAAGQQAGLRHYLIGGGPGVAEVLREKLQRRFPHAEIVGSHTPPYRALTNAEEQQLVAEINDLAPHCVWVGLSTPKQERFMAGLLERYGRANALDCDAQHCLSHPLVMFGVGAAFDFHAGLTPQAPRWMQQSGLEWSYRLLKEPRRLWKRYLTNNPLFVYRIAMQLSGLRKYELPEAQTAVHQRSTFAS